MGIRRRAIEKRLPIAFFLALLLLGWLTCAGYGQPWDEPWEQDILRMNVNQIAAAFGSGARLALTSSIDVPASGLIADSVEKDHGASAYYPVFFLVSSNRISESARMLLWHAYTWLWFVAGAAALYALSRKLGLSAAAGCAAALFFVLTPRFFAQGHYNNKDMVLLSLALLLLWLTWLLMEKPTAGRALLFALLGAIAANTKVVGAFLFGLCALAALTALLFRRQNNRRTWVAALTAALGFPSFYILLTPAAWGDPAGYLSYTIRNAVAFSRWDFFVQFRGAVFDLSVNPLPRYYLPYMILVTTPLWLLALMGIGQVFALSDLAGARKRPLPHPLRWMLIACTLLWIVPLAFVMIARPTLYNGWRHFYFLAAPLLCLAAYGYKRSIDVLKRFRKPALRYAAAGILAAAMAVTGASMARSHPAQYTYYNALLSGRDLPRYMELDYWNVSALPTVRRLLDTADTELSIAGADLWSQAGLEAAYDLLSDTEQARVTVLPQGDAAADYILSNPTYANFSGWQPDGKTLAVQTESYGWPICEIYAQGNPSP